MAKKKTKYGKYIVTKPDRTPISYEVKAPRGNDYVGFNYIPYTYISGKTIKGINHFTGLIWVTETGCPNPWTANHTHDFDEIMLFLGTDPENPEDLGGEVDIQLGDEIHKIDKTASVFVPKGLSHAPIWYKRIDRPHAFIAFCIDTPAYD
ncbi:hypothetical protein ACFL1Z_06905 [Thermodesulfobacteriota bacterium]